MTVIYIVLPLAIVLAAFAVAGFMWAVRRGQYDDMDTPPIRAILDDDGPVGRASSAPSGPTGRASSPPSRTPAAGKMPAPLEPKPD